jgi:hypothetical protein
MMTRAFVCALLMSVPCVSTVNAQTSAESGAGWVILDSLDQEVGTVNGEVGSTATVVLFVEGRLVRGWDDTTPPQRDRQMNFRVTPDGFLSSAGVPPVTVYTTPNCSGTPFFPAASEVSLEGFVPTASVATDGRVYMAGEPLSTIEVRSRSIRSTGRCEELAPAPMQVGYFTSFALADLVGNLVPPFRAVLRSLPPAEDWTFCAPEGGFCAFTGQREVRYGANGAFFFRTVTGGTACTNSVFGDPAPDTAKQCAIR